MQVSEPTTLCSRSLRHQILSVNAKQLAYPALQAGPSRCESGHGCQCWLNASCPRSSVRFRAPPCEGGGRRCNSCRGHQFAPVPQQPQERFRKPLFVGASPTRGSNFKSGSWCNSSTSRCERDGSGANPGFLTNFRRREGVVVPKRQTTTWRQYGKSIVRSRQPVFSRSP